MQKVIVTVIGKDCVGIIARVSSLLAQYSVNILDISQTVLKEEYFTMVMMTDISTATTSFAELQQRLFDLGEKMCLKIHMQHSDIFEAMHTVG